MLQFWSKGSSYMQWHWQSRASSDAMCDRNYWTILHGLPMISMQIDQNPSILTILVFACQFDRNWQTKQLVVVKHGWCTRRSVQAAEVVSFWTFLSFTWVCSSCTGCFLFSHRNWFSGTPDVSVGSIWNQITISNRSKCYFLCVAAIVFQSRR